MSPMLAARVGSWEPLDAESIWWHADYDGQRALLEPREHAALAACATFHAREVHVATISARLGLTGSRAARLLDGLLERGLLVSADAVLGDAASLPATTDHSLAFGQPPVEPAALPTQAPDATALLGTTWAELATRFGVNRATLVGHTPEALEPWRTGVRVRAVVGAHACWTGAFAPARPGVATCAAAAILAHDATEPQPFAIDDAALEGAWLVVALDAMHGPGSVLALPVAAATAPAADPGALAALASLAGATPRFASRDPRARFAALCAVAADLADAPDDVLAVRLLKSRRATISGWLAAAPPNARAMLESELLAPLRASDDNAAARALLARIGRGGAHA